MRRGADIPDARAVAVAVAAPAVRADELIWPALVAIAGIAAVLPLWASELLPFQDAPQHLAAIRVLADYRAPAFGFEKWFEIDLFRLQYLGFYLPAAALAKLFGPDAACRIALSLIGLSIPASVWMLLGAFGRDRRMAVFAPAVFHTLPLYMGFFNFVESVPAAIAIVAVTERHLREPTRRRAAAIAAGAVVLLWLHPSALAFALASAGGLAVTSRQRARNLAARLAPWLPAVTLLGIWAVQAILARDGAGAAAHTVPRWLPMRVRALDLVRFANVIGGRADEVFVFALAALCAAAGFARRDRGPGALRLGLLALCTLLAYFAAPFDMGYMSWISHRALPFVFILAIAAAAPAEGRAAGVLCAAAVLLQIAYGAKLASTYRAFDREADVAGLHQVLSAAEPGARLVAQIRDARSEVVQFSPYLQFGAYYELLRGGRSRFNFAETPWTPVRFRRGTAPPAMPQSWEWHPEWVDLAAEATREDYLLVRGPAAEPISGFTLRARAGPWSLYRSATAPGG